jgi:hypothetical protein
MIELAIVACLLDQPGRCKDVSLVYMADAVTPMQCMMASGAEIAKWGAVNPRWFVRKWTCRPAGRWAKV